VAEKTMFCIYGTALIKGFGIIFVRVVQAPESDRFTFKGKGFRDILRRRGTEPPC
jgi:hypothetical protein